MLAFKPSFRYLYQQGRNGGASLRIKSRYFQYDDFRRDTSLPVVFSIDTAQKAVLFRITPRFTSVDYGQPGY